MRVAHVNHVKEGVKGGGWRVPMSTACALGALARKASYSADLIAVSDTFLVKYAGKRVHVSKRPPMSTGADNPG